MSLDTTKSNLTKIRNSADTIYVKNLHLPSPDANKHQTEIDNKTAPKFSSAPLPPQPPPHPKHHHHGS